MHAAVPHSSQLKHICRCQDLQEHQPCQAPTFTRSETNTNSKVLNYSLLTWVRDGDEAGAIEEAVPGVPAPGLVVGVHRHRRPRQQAVRTSAAAGALDGGAVALGAGELHVALQRGGLRRRLGDTPGLGRLKKVMLVWMLKKDDGSGGNLPTFL